MPITREDIEAKAMEIIGAVDETREAAKDKAVLGLVVAAGSCPGLHHRPQARLARQDPGRVYRI